MGKGNLFVFGSNRGMLHGNSGREFVMKSILTGNVLRHVVSQFLTVAFLGAAGALAHADYSAFGAYAAPIQGLVAASVAILNEALGTAPK